MPESPGDLFALSRSWLDSHPGAALSARLCMAAVVAAGGDVRNEAAVEDVAALAGCSPETVIPVLAALRAADA